MVNAAVVTRPVACTACEGPFSHRFLSIFSASRILCAAFALPGALRPPHLAAPRVHQSAYHVPVSHSNASLSECGRETALGDLRVPAGRADSVGQRDQLRNIALSSAVDSSCPACKTCALFPTIALGNPPYSGSGIVRVGLGPGKAWHLPM